MTDRERPMLDSFPEQPVRLADTDRGRHCYVIGGTGTGKLKLLRSMMISQAIERGECLCVIDPYWDWYEELLFSIPNERARDLIVIDLAETENSDGSRS